MLRLTLLVTVVLSFLNFVNPNTFAFVDKNKEKVLGIDRINQSINIETVKTGLLVYCIEKGYLPTELNDLYRDVLSREKFLDLDKTFSYSLGKDCKFNLTPK